MPRLWLYCFRVVCILNICFLSPYVFGWQYFSYNDVSVNSRHAADFIAFFQFNWFVLIAASALIAGIIGLLKSWRSVQLWHLLIVLAFFSVFLIIGWGEYQYDKSVGASRGALESVIISAIMLIGNISVFLSLFWTVITTHRNIKEIGQ